MPEMQYRTNVLLIMEYRIVNAASVFLLENAVRKGIGLGWRPLGAPFFIPAHSTHNAALAQAMVKGEPAYQCAPDDNPEDH